MFSNYNVICKIYLANYNRLEPSFETNIPTGPNSVKGKNENSQQIVCNNNIMDSLTLSQRDLNKFWDDQEVVGQLKEILYTRGMSIMMIVLDLMSNF